MVGRQVGDEMVGTIMKFSSPWVQCLLLGIFCLSGCCCGCCCCCCCCFNFCCGKCAPELKDMEDIPDVAEFEDEEDDEVVTEQPGMVPIRTFELSIFSIQECRQPDFVF